MNNSVTEAKYRKEVIEILRKTFEQMFAKVDSNLVFSTVLIPNRKHRSLNLS